MKRRLPFGEAALVLAALMVAGCAHNPIPKGYVGPTARIHDTHLYHNEQRSDFFVVSEVNGRRIHDSGTETINYNQGRGLKMEPRVIYRAVPAEKSRFHIVGQAQYAAPILYLVYPTYSVEGEIEFTPEPDGFYVVEGVVGEDYSAVWIVDGYTGEIVGNKIEKVSEKKLSGQPEKTSEPSDEPVSRQGAVRPPRGPGGNGRH